MQRFKRLHQFFLFFIRPIFLTSPHIILEVGFFELWLPKRITELDVTLPNLEPHTLLDPFHIHLHHSCPGTGRVNRLLLSFSQELHVV